jgi:hypothetical protein
MGLQGKTPPEAAGIKVEDEKPLDDAKANALMAKLDNDEARWSS